MQLLILLHFSQYDINTNISNYHSNVTNAVVPTQLTNSWDRNWLVKRGVFQELASKEKMGMNVNCFTDTRHQYRYHMYRLFYMCKCLTLPHRKVAWNRNSPNSKNW